MKTLILKTQKYAEKKYGEKWSGTLDTGGGGLKNIDIPFRFSDKMIFWQNPINMSISRIITRNKWKYIYIRICDRIMVLGFCKDTDSRRNTWAAWFEDKCKVHSNAKENDKNQL